MTTMPTSHTPFLFSQETLIFAIHHRILSGPCYRYLTRLSTSSLLMVVLICIVSHDSVRMFSSKLRAACTFRRSPYRTHNLNIVQDISCM